ncbi:MAG: ABC transporter substrate-binding protein [Pseudomonadales bacterium]|nr:ABC transporter substrate-binding protein [Pseudomonadales bacterium]
MSCFSMKLFGLLLFASVFTVPQALACGKGQAIVSGGTNYPPLTWREDGQGKLIGAAVDLSKKLFAEVSITATADEGGPWKRVLLRAKRGEVDMLLGVRKTPEREQYLHFLEPVLTPSVQSVFVREDTELKFSEWTDLSGKAGGIILGASFSTEFDAYADNSLYIEEARSYKQNFEKLSLGRIDYLLGPLMTVRLHLSKEGYNRKIINLKEPLIIIDEYLAIPKKSECSHYVGQFSERLNQLLEAGEMDTLIEHQFLNWFQKQQDSDLLDL